MLEPDSQYYDSTKQCYQAARKISLLDPKALEDYATQTISCHVTYAREDSRKVNLIEAGQEELDEVKIERETEPHDCH